MALRTSLKKLMFKVDHLEPSYRIGVLIGSLCFITALWYYLIYSPQSSVNTSAHDQIINLSQQSEQLKQKQIQILALAKLPKTKQLIARYNFISAQIKTINEQLNLFQYRFIDTKMLADKLQTLLLEVEDIKIESFRSLPPPIKKMPVEEKKPPKKTPPKQKTPPKKPAPKEIKPQLLLYELTIRGNYFAILQFLQRIERLEWQIFWQQLIFEVVNYPINRATIKFYTLKPLPPSVGVEAHL